VRPGGHGLIVRGGSGNPEAAEKTCARFRPSDPGKTDATPQQRVEGEEDLQRFAKCMREHGIHVETSPVGGGRIEFHPGAGAPNPESPGFRRAQSACSKLVPGGLPGGPAPAG
jgi:hypothetical protein